MEQLPQPIVRNGKEYWLGTEQNPYNARSINMPLGEDAEIIRADQDIRPSFPHLVEKWRNQSSEESPVNQLP